MTIYEYIKEYGKYSFKERKFNEVDCVIFAAMGYANLENILNKTSKMTIREVALKHMEMYKGRDKNIIAVRVANKIFREMKDTKRYKDCLIFNYDYIGNTEIQFGVFSIEYEKNKVYVSFQGTNELFSGWIDDFMLSCKFPTISHKKAINYLNKHYTFSNKELIVGGHSKGGNLALVAGMYANFIVKNRIKLICNADGPGLLDREFTSIKYKDISDKYIHIIPDSSYIGLLLNHSNDKVIKASSKGILSHAANYWVVDGNHFKKSELNAMSKQLDIKLRNWLVKYNEQDMYSFVSNLDIILRKADVNSALDLVNKNHKIFSLIRESKEMSEDTKKIIKDLINIILDCFKTSKKEELKDSLNAIFKNKNNKTKEGTYENING